MAAEDIVFEMERAADEVTDEEIDNVLEVDTDTDGSEID